MSEPYESVILSYFDHIKENGIPSIEILEVMMHSLLKQNKIDLLEELLHWTVSTNVTPSTKMFNSLLTGLSRTKNLGKMKQYYDMMVELSIKPDIATYTILIMSYGKLGKNSGVEKFLQEAQNSGLELSQTTFNVLLDFYGRVKNIEKLDEYERKMLSSGHRYSIVAINTLLKTFCKLKDFKRIESYIKIIENEGIRMDVYTLNALLKLYTSEDRMDLVEKYENLSKRYRISYDHATYKLMIQYWGLKGDLPKAEALLEEMEFNGFSKNEHILKALMFVYGSNGDIQKTYYYLNEYRQGYRIDDYVKTLLMNAHAKVGNVNKVFKINETIRNRDITAFDILLEVFGRGRNFENQQSCLYDLINTNIKPTANTFKILFSSAYSHKQMEIYWDLMDKYEITLTEKLCYAILDKSLQIDNKESLDRFFTLPRNFTLSNDSYEKIIWYYLARDRKRMESLLEEMIHNKLKPSANLLKEILQSTQVKAEYDRITELIKTEK
jgi:leucine-rich PPR motif-containing protein